MSGLLRRQGSGGSDFRFPLRTIGRLNGGSSDIHSPILFQNIPNWFWYYEDFLWDAFDADEHPLHIYDHSPSGSPTKGLVSNGTGGQFQLKGSSTSEAQTLAMTMGDKLYIQGNKPFYFEARVQTVHAMAANQVVIVGLGSEIGDDPVTFDYVDRNCWFRQDADTDLLLECDDATTDQDDKDTGTDITAAEWYTYAIERGTNGKLYYALVNDDGFMKTWSLPEKFGGTDPSFGANNLQPIIAVHKASGTTTPEVLIDYVLFGGAR